MQLMNTRDSPGRPHGVLVPPSGIRRHQSCAECQKTFKTRNELIWHAEACLLEAFENEVLTVTSDAVSRPKFHLLSTKQVTPAGITVKSMDAHPRQEYIKLKVGDDKGQPCQETVEQGGQPMEESVVFEQDVPESQTIEGPGGLQLVVSVEKNGPRLSDNIEQPPVLDAQIGDVEEMTGYHEEEMDDDLGEEDDVIMRSSGGYSGASTSQVIGALANANDDLYKPKMECPTCGLVLYRHNFAAHYRIHTGELPFACNFCPKRFRTTSSLKVHVRAHTGEKPYQCPQCNYATITKRNLDRHILIHHVRTPHTKGPATRRSRYRDNEEVEWVDLAALQQEQYGNKEHHYADTNSVNGADIMARATAETEDIAEEYVEHQ